MAAMERRFSINGLQLAALEWPGEGVPIIALHGWLDNAASFIPLSEHLTQHHLLAVDLPGHGHSDHLPASAAYHLADNLKFISGLADSMGWQRFVLLGHSMGAAIACIAAAAMPQRVVALSLLDGLGPLALSPELEVKRLRQLFAEEQEARPSRPFDSIDLAARLRQRHNHFPISLEAAQIIVERSLQQREDGYHWRYDRRLKEHSSHYYTEQQVAGILAAIESPSMLISADDGALARWSSFGRRREALQGLQHVKLPGGHHLHMESPQATAGQLQGFYRQFAEGAV